MTYALVLGSGGVTGIAWETGLLKGLRDGGLDLTGADLILGTSAGSVVGTQVATGVSLDELYLRQVTSARGPRERPPNVGRLLDLSSAGAADGRARIQSRPTKEVLAWIGGQARAASTRINEATQIAVIEARLPVHDWPDRRLLVTAIDTATGDLVVWERSSDVPLPRAVASSCAVPWVYPPVKINGRRYMDGGMRSATNADLVAGQDLVVIVAPAAASGWSKLVDEEADELRAAGACVVVVIPDCAAIEAIGPNPLDPALRTPAAEAGLAQGLAAAGTMAEIRAHLTA